MTTEDDPIEVTEDHHFEAIETMIEHSLAGLSANMKVPEDLVRPVARLMLLLNLAIERLGESHSQTRQLEEAYTEAFVTARALHEAEAQLRVVTGERDEAREQLQRIGRKAFWASSTRKS